jgi:hypothetical protein
MVKVFASTVFRSAGVHEADAEVSPASDEHALKDAANRRIGKANPNFFNLFCMKVLPLSANSRINYLIKHQMNLSALADCTLQSARSSPGAPHRGGGLPLS